MLRWVIRILVGLGLVLVLAATGLYIWSSTDGREFTSPRQKHYIRDEQGRALILRGVNDDGCVKAHHLPCADRVLVRKEAELGFNFVRHLTQWRSIEPNRGEYDEAYLDAIEERLDWYHEYGIRVMIDMHVDLYGPAVGGNGHPAWATVSDGASQLPFDTGQFWWLNYISGAVSTAYRNFWDYQGEHPWLQDSYIKLWQKVASRFGSHPAVLGYDLINEPWENLDPGREFEIERLAPFYQRLINGIREVDRDSWLMFEPRIFGTDWGFGSYLPPLEDPRPGDKRLVYAPHLYPFFSHEGSYDRAGIARRLDLRMMHRWSEQRAAEIDRHGVPLLIGEFGMTGKPWSREMVDATVGLADAMGASWAWWENSLCPPDQPFGYWCLFDRNYREMPLVDHLVRTYPRAVAGEPVAYGFDPQSKAFFLEFISDPGIEAPTEIFLPSGRHYPGGWQISSSDPEGSWRYEWDEERQLLLLWVDKTGRHRIDIQALP